MTQAQEIQESAPAPRQNRSGEERAMRDLCVARLRTLYPGARIIHELPLRYNSNRIDLAAVTEDRIVAVEIKSSRDVMTRLRAQLENFKPVASLVIAAIAPKWNEKLATLTQPLIVKGRTAGTTYVPQYTETQRIIRDVGGIETWTVCHETGGVDVETCYEKRVPWSHAMLDLLWREELFQVAFDHRIATTTKSRHSDIRDDCERLMTGKEVRLAVCQALRARDAFDKASDPPIVGTVA